MDTCYIADATRVGNVFDRASNVVDFPVQRSALPLLSKISENWQTFGTWFRVASSIVTTGLNDCSPDAAGEMAVNLASTEIGLRLALSAVSAARDLEVAAREAFPVGAFAAPLALEVASNDNEPSDVESGRSRITIEAVEGGHSVFVDGNRWTLQDGEAIALIGASGMTILDSGAGPINTLQFVYPADLAGGVAI